MMDFTLKISKFMQLNAVTPPGAGRVGVALSGGPHSVALLAVLSELGYNCVALNCNFGLRGAESLRDTEHSRYIAETLGCGFRTISFDVEARRQHTGESVEMACRSLRYEWFDTMARELNLQFVALGHHRNDRTETFFINALRGCGPRGLTSMRFSRDIFIRPLLAASPLEIEQYLQTRGLPFVVDSSNLSVDYRRNALRNSIMPLLRQHFPMADENLANTIGQIESATNLYDYLLEQHLKPYVDGTSVDVGRIVADIPQHAPQLIFEATRRLNAPLSASRINEVIGAAGKSGRSFGSWHLDRGILSLLPDATHPEARIVGPESWPFAMQTLSPEEFTPRRQLDKAWFDARILDGNPTFELRPWRISDRMRPFGMRGSRLVSDIFRDAHYSLAQKQHTMLLTRNDVIIWIPGLKQSAHFPVTGQSLSVIELSLLP